jgi:ubiquinol-cytochrome c reductase cytochrome c subunit
VTDDIDADDELGFEPAVSATGADAAAGESKAPARRRRRRNGARRRLGAGLVLIGALGAMGWGYAAFATTSGATDTGASAADVAAGRTLYETSCITCHGANLDGVTTQGPSLLGVGSAAVYFQVSTGRMPIAQQGADSDRKTPKFDEKQTEQLAAYVEAMGGGPALPAGHLEGADSSIAEGGTLFRLNCASCHGTTFKGAPLSAGKIAPSLNAATNKQLYAAMLSGPENMPVFSDNTLSPNQKAAIIAYVQNLKASNDPGGSGIDRIGPVSEAIVIWVAGVGALMIAILWIGARAR